MTRSLPAMIAFPPSAASVLAMRMKRAAAPLPSPLWGGSAPTDRREAPSDDRLRAGVGGARRSSDRPPPPTPPRKGEGSAPALLVSTKHFWLLRIVARITSPGIFRKLS